MSTSDLMFLFNCLDSVPGKIDFTKVGLSTSSNPSAARMKYKRMRERLQRKQISTTQQGRAVPDVETQKLTTRKQPIPQSTKRVHFQNTRSNQRCKAPVDYVEPRAKWACRDKLTYVAELDSDESRHSRHVTHTDSDGNFEAEKNDLFDTDESDEVVAMTAPKAHKTSSIGRVRQNNSMDSTDSLMHSHLKRKRSSTSALSSQDTATQKHKSSTTVGQAARDEICPSPNHILSKDTMTVTCNDHPIRCSPAFLQEDCVPAFERSITFGGRDHVNAVTLPQKTETTTSPSNLINDSDQIKSALTLLKTGQTVTVTESKSTNYNERMKSSNMKADPSSSPITVINLQHGCRCNSRRPVAAETCPSLNPAQEVEVHSCLSRDDASTRTDELRSQKEQPLEQHTSLVQRAASLFRRTLRQA